MVLETLTAQQKKLIDEIAFENGFHEYQIKVKQGTERGENFLSIIKNIKIISETTNESVDVFMKCAQTAEQLREQLPVKNIFEREINCYKYVFPKFRQIHNEQNAESNFPTFAMMYGYSKDELFECIALEDLRNKGFRMCDKKKTMDENHIQIVLKQYGKIHAYSFALKRHYPLEYENMRKAYVSVFKNTRPEEESKAMMKKQFEEVIKLLDDRRLIEALEVYSNEAYHTVNGLSDEQSVLVHGDCWCNNFLFSYENQLEPENPSNVCMIDWQISAMATPVTDLSYFLCTCAPKEVLRNYEKYLKVYYDSLSGMLKELKCEPEELFTYEDLLSHWRRYCKFGLYISILVIKVMLSDASEAPDLQGTAESGQNILEAFSYDMAHSEKYKSRISDVIQFMLDNGFI